MKSTSEPFRVRVSLWMIPGADARFAEFEAHAFDIMTTHGVTDITILKPQAVLGGEPDEIHDIVFPSRAAFDNYRADPKLLSLADLRQRAILRTEIEFDDDG